MLTTALAARLDAGTIVPRAQDHSRATLAPLLEKGHGRIEWTWPARKIYDRMRGFTPWPGAYASFRGRLYHIWGRPMEKPERGAVSAPVEPGTMQTDAGELYVACGEGTWLRVDAVQAEGRKRISAKEFISGARLISDEHFDPA